MTEMTEKTETATVQGRIIRALGGFYYIDTPEGLVECRARGVFRKEGVTPYVGDLARAELTGEGKGYLIELLPRKNFLIRPPVANIDLLVLVVSTVSPAPNRFVLDKMLAVAEHKGIEPMLAVTKSDLRRDPELLADYRKAGYRCLGTLLGYRGGCGRAAGTAHRRPSGGVQRQYRRRQEFPAQRAGTRPESCHRRGQ